MVENGSNLTAKTFELRKDILDIICQAGCGHIGGDLSVTDILTVLYKEVMNVSPERTQDEDRDRFIMSKGHSVEAYYAVLADCGFFPKEDLETCSQFGSKYIGHPTNKVNGIEMNSGSLGHGLPVATGMALAGKMDQKDYRVYTVMGDGELAEGSVWEAVMAGAHYKLDNLCAVIDRNRLQISGSTEDVMAHGSQEERWAAFGWHVISVNGNDVGELRAAFAEAAQVKGKPTVVVANTIKGYGVSFMENQAGWHHKVPDKEQYDQAVKELEERSVAAYE